MQERKVSVNGGIVSPMLSDYLRKSAKDYVGKTNHGTGTGKNVRHVFRKLQNVLRNLQLCLDLLRKYSQDIILKSPGTY